MADLLLNTFKIIQNLSNCSLVYILSGNQSECKIIHYYGELDENDPLLIELNSDIIKLNHSTASDIKYVSSFIRIQKVYNFHSLYINNVEHISSDKTILVCLSRNETLFNKSIKDKLSLCIPVINSFLLKYSKSDDDSTPLVSYEDKYNFLLNNTEDIVFNLNNHGVIISFNQLGARTLGLTASELTGKHLLDIVPDEDKENIINIISKILSNPHKQTFDLPVLDKQNKKIIFRINAKQIVIQKSLHGMICYGKNLANMNRNRIKIEELREKYKEATRLVAIEKDRARQQISVLEELNRLKNDFISNISHELRTPLASIIGFSETIASDPDMAGEMINEFNNIILVEGKRLAKLVNDILDFSKLETGEQVLEKSEFNIIDILRELHLVYVKNTDEKNITFSMNIPDAEIIIYADRERIIRVFSHVITNAIKFTNNNGRISIIVTDFLKEVEIIINDTGIGIPKDQLPYIFQKFNKLNRPGQQTQGAGFGLITVKQIVDAHKGLVQIKSDIDQGTSVVIRLPKNINNL